MGLSNRRGRKRKATVVRDPMGKSRGEPESEVKAVVLAYRAKEVGPEAAPDPLAGFTLGKLLLRSRASPSDPSGISEDQYHAGEEYARRVRWMNVIDGLATGSPKSPSFVMVGSGMSCTKPPSEAQVKDARDKYREVHEAVVEASLIYGTRLRSVVHSICVEQQRPEAFSKADFGLLRLGLNAVARVLR